MTPQLINTITNVAAVIIVIVGAVQQYLSTQPFNWLTFIMYIMTALVAYFTGKSTAAQNKLNGTTKLGS